MPRCLFALGSNSGDRAWHSGRIAYGGSRSHPQIRLEKRSNWRETTPIGGPPLQKPYLNGAAIVETSLAPHDFLQALNEVEHQLGRRRGRRWDSRTIDLDLLLYEELSLSTPTLDAAASADGLAAFRARTGGRNRGRNAASGDRLDDSTAARSSQQFARLTSP